MPRVELIPIYLIPGKVWDQPIPVTPKDGSYGQAVAPLNTNKVRKTGVSVTGSGFIIGAFAAFQMTSSVADCYVKISIDVDGLGAQEVYDLRSRATTISNVLSGGVGLLIRFKTGFTPSMSYLNAAKISWGVIYIIR